MKNTYLRPAKSLGQFGRTSYKAYRAAILGALALLPFVGFLQAREIGDKPNIIIFYADDLGNGDLEYNALGSRFARTPGIDRLFKQGVYLSNYLTHSMCSPSRAGLLTGRHYTEVGSALNVGGNLDKDVINIAKDFQANGYYTGAFGKWHNGTHPRRPRPDITSVNDYGFDEWAGFYGGSTPYVNRSSGSTVDWWDSRIGDPNDGDRIANDLSGYSTEITGANVLKFVEDSIARDEPFFAYVPFGMIHSPYNIYPRQLKEFCDLIDEDHPELSWANVGAIQGLNTNARIDSLPPEYEMLCNNNDDFDKDEIDNQLHGFSELIYYAMIYVMDKQIEETVQAIAADQAVFKNTIFVFSSDNGATRSGNNAPFQGRKLTLWEGGIHVPSAIWWPGAIGDPDYANASQLVDNNLDYEHLTQYVDWYPTLIEAAGLSLDPAADLDGLSFFDELSTEANARNLWEASHAYYGLGYERAAVSNGQYKLLYNHVPGEFHQELLFEIYEDKTESANLAGNPLYTDQLNDLKKMLDDWFASGEVTASYMRLPDSVANAVHRPAPSGDVLEITAQQTGSNASLENSLYIQFASQPDWESTNIDQRVFPGDVLEYDIYVANDSEQVKGMFVTPTYREALSGSALDQPLVNRKRGLGLDNGLLAKQELPTGSWVRCAVGIGDTAPYRSSQGVYAGLFSPDQGAYTFYLDNVVIRKPDGTERSVIWKDSSHNHGGNAQFLYFVNGRVRRLNTGDLPSGVPFSSASVGIANAADLPNNPQTAYADWINAFPSLTGNDAAMTANPDGGIYNNLFEYALGGDPTDAKDDSAIRPVIKIIDDTSPHLEFSFYRHKDFSDRGLLYNVLHSDDLESFSWPPADLLEIAATDAEFTKPGFERVAVKRSLSGNSEWFMLLDISISDSP